MVTAGATLLAAVAATLGYLAGLRAKSAGGRSRRRRDEDSLVARLGWSDEICECGVLLPAGTPDKEIQQHKCSNRHEKNLLALKDASEIVVCEEVGEYRAAAQMLVNGTDYVLEVGSHVGGTTKVIAGVAKHVIGLDQQASLVEQARQKLPNVQFEVGDAFDAPSIIALASTISPNRLAKVFVDISGSRDLPTVVRLIDMYENTLRPETIVVKSQTLKRILLRSRLWVDHPRNSQCRWRLFDEPRR
jgi:hypothetical protein